MRHGWALDAAYVERRERLEKERMDRALRRLITERQLEAAEREVDRILALAGSFNTAERARELATRMFPAETRRIPDA